MHVFNNEYSDIDVPGCVGTHALAGMWSLLAVGLFARKDMLGEALAISTEHAGLFQVLRHIYLLYIQCNFIHSERPINRSPLN